MHKMDVHVFIALMSLAGVSSTAHECKLSISTHECTENDMTLHINTSLEPQLITSPGFPQHYPNSFRCSMRLTTDDDHVLHVEVVHMQLSVWNSTCGQHDMGHDYVIAYEGDSVLHEWCGTDYTPVASSDTSLYLEFRSNAQVTDMGFGMRVWSQKSVNTSCLAKGRDILVGDRPVYLTVPDIKEDSGHFPQTCVYHLDTGYTHSTITLNIQSWNPSVASSIDKLEIKGDLGTELCWSGASQPFSKFTSSGTNITIKLRFCDVLSDTFTLRAIRNSKPQFCDTDSPPAEEITSLPSYFRYPAQWDRNGIPCPLKIISKDFSKTLRLDVVSSDEKWADSHGSEQFNITEGSVDGDSILPSTLGDISTYRSRSPVVYISTKLQLGRKQAIVVRVRALESLLNGQVTVLNAVNSTVSPALSVTNIPDDAYIVYTIRDDDPGNLIQLHMKGNLNLNKTLNEDCELNFIDFYDGNPEDKLLRRWCPVCDEEVTIRSTKSYLSFVLTTSVVSTKSYVRGTYFSLRSTSMCKPKLVDLKASAAMTKFVMSPNFPGTYSVNNVCIWRIAAPRINYVVIATVINSDLPDDCSDLVYVIYDVLPEDKVHARICGTDTPTFRSTWAVLILKFTSNSQGNRSGFKIAYTTEHRTGGRRTKGGPPVGIIAGACIALFIVGGIIYVIVHENRKRHKEAKRTREEY